MSALRRLPRRSIGPLALLVFSLVAVGAVFWGRLVADPEFQILTFDAGPVADLAIGDFRALDGLDAYLLVLEDGRVRAVDGIVQSSGCAVRLDRDDERGRARNPLGAPGVFVDPCTGDRWALTGDAIGGDRPLRTFFVSYRSTPNGERHVYVEVLGRSPSTSNGR